jgi:uncharacterized cupredoxin-like copper-binding protein
MNKQRLYLILMGGIVFMSACATQARSGPTAVEGVPARPSITQGKLILTVDDRQVSPSVLKATVGQTLTLTLENKGTALHDFTVKDIPIAHEAVSHGASHDMSYMQDDHLDVHVAVEPGQSGTVTFMPTTPGTYEFYCTLPGHKEAGLKGEFIVESQ